MIDEREKKGLEVDDSMRDPRFDQDVIFFLFEDMPMLFITTINTMRLGRTMTFV